jgi:glycosyltransferase involved in cell wall biosynthesis
MNILFLCDEYPPVKPGGIGRYTERLSEWLTKQGHKILVVGSYKGISSTIHESVNGVEIWRLPIVGSTWGGKIELLSTRLQLRFFVERLIKRHDLQLLEGPDYQGSLWMMPHGIRKVCRIHSSKILLRRKEDTRLLPSEYIEDWGVQNADYIVAVSKYSETMAQKYWKSTRNKNITIIPNPISDCFFSDHAENEESIKKILVFSGSIGSHKGVPELLEAWSIVHERHPDYKLNLYGKPGNSTQILQQAIIDSDDSISWFGAVDEIDLCEIYKTVSVGVFPSHFESEGMAAKEAAASGMPIVVSGIPPFKELFADFPGVFYFDPKNTISLSKAILDAIDSQNKKNTYTLVKNMKNYTMDHIGQMNYEFYLKVLS